MAAKKKVLTPKSKRLAVAPPPVVTLDPEDMLIEGLRNIGLAAGVVDARGRARIYTVKYRLHNGLLPGFQRGKHWYSTLRLLRGMNQAATSKHGAHKLTAAAAEAEAV
jgi:hypothetical protein